MDSRLKRSAEKAVAEEQIIETKRQIRWRSFFTVYLETDYCPPLPDFIASGNPSLLEMKSSRATQLVINATFQHQVEKRHQGNWMPCQSPRSSSGRATTEQSSSGQLSSALPLALVLSQERTKPCRPYFKGSQNALSGPAVDIFAECLLKKPRHPSGYLKLIS